MNQNMRKFCSAAAAFALLTAGCSDQETNSSADPTGTASVQEQKPSETAKENRAEEQSVPLSQEIPTVLLSDPAPSPSCDISDLFTDRDKRNTYDTPLAVITCTGDAVSVEGTGASAKGTDVTITEEGVYLISGTLNDGQILVNSSGKVQLVLDGASLSCSDSAPIYVQQAKKCFLTLADGTENSVSDGTAYVYAQEGENEPDAAIFSADSLTVNGTGALTVSGNYNEGITCKDDLVITSSTLRITSVGNGIKGRDYVAIAGGDVTVTAGADGIKSNNATDAGMGFVYIEGGTVTVDAQEDAVQAESECILTGGTLHLKAGGGAENAQPQMNNDFGNFSMHGGFDKSWSEDAAETAEDTAVNTKALKAGTLLHITGGTCTIDSADDGLHSNGSLFIGGGSLEIAAGGDGIHADMLADLADGEIRITRSNEGIEAAGIRISGGTVEVNASDDGLNASDGTSQGGMGTYSSGAALEISGGELYVNANGDGLDSNGDMLISGGTVIVDGPTNDGNGALDGNGGMYCTGGTLIASGSSGMAECPRGSQNTVVLTLGSYQTADSEVVLMDASGTKLLTHTPAKQFSSVIFSSPEIMDGETLTASVSGTECGSCTIGSVLSYIGEAGGMRGGFHGGGWGHGMGGGRGNRQDMQLPTDENGELTLPEGMEIPERMEPPQDMTMPEGMEPPPGGFGGMMPEDLQIS